MEQCWPVVSISSPIRPCLRAFAEYFTALLLRSINSHTTGLSLRVRSWGFPQATMSMTPRYFCRKQRENETKRTL